MQQSRGDNQHRILEYIKEEIQNKGYPPSVREIANAVGLKSTSTVHGHLRRLEKRGLIHRDPLKPRAMEVVGDPSFVRNNTTAVPLVGRIQSGSSVLAEQNLEDFVSLPDVMLEKGEHFIFRVHGNSMADAGIRDGDYAVARLTGEVPAGGLAVIVSGECCETRRLLRDGSQTRLQAEGPDAESIPARHARIVGEVISLFRLMK